MNTKSDNYVQFRISDKGNRMDIDTRDNSRLSIQFIKKQSNAWSNAILTIRCSHDAANILDFPQTITITGETRIVLDVSDVKYVHAVVTTAESTTSDIYVNYYVTNYQS